MSLRDYLRELRARDGKVIVVGMGVSGTETARFLKRAGLNVICVEKSAEDSYLCAAQKGGTGHGAAGETLAELRGSGVEINFGVDGEAIADYLDGVGFAVLSPGVPIESSVAGSLKFRGIRIISELELGVELSGLQSVVVTGSNGKSTTVSLIHHILKHAGIDSILCGNVGDPVVKFLPADALEPQTLDRRTWLIVEASSYQLEACEVLHPRAAVLLNLSENHLERHGTMERYLMAKSKAFVRQSSADYAILNCDDQLVKSLTGSLASSVLGFGCGDMETTGRGCEIDYNPSRGFDRLRVRLGSDPEIYELSEANLIGRHNRYNAAAAILTCRLLGAAVAKIQEAIITFQPLEHRMEQIPMPEGCRIRVINDSKSTTVAATCAAFLTVREHFAAAQIKLLLGGIAKAGSWEPLFKLLRADVQSLCEVVCFGADSRLLSGICAENRIPCYQAENVESALKRSFERVTRSEEVILFSPGCASFDEFPNFAARGAAFKEAVAKEARKGS